jgi:hypothetical protein
MIMTWKCFPPLMYLWKPAVCTLSTGYTLVILHSQGLCLTLRRCQDMEWGCGAAAEGRKLVETGGSPFASTSTAKPVVGIVN